MHVFLVPGKRVIEDDILSFRGAAVPQVLLFHTIDQARRTVGKLRKLPIDFITQRDRSVSGRVGRVLLRSSFVGGCRVSMRAGLSTKASSILGISTLASR